MIDDSAENFRDDGDRSKSKISGDSNAEKGTETEEVEVVNRQQAPKVSVKVERQQNLGHYNNATAQVFFSSGTLEHLRGDVVNGDGEIKDEVEEELAQIAADLEKLARNRVIDALKKHANAGIDVDADVHEVSS